MYEEIDLRPYVLALFRNWMWIVGAAVLAAAAAFGVSSLLPPTYEARAAVAVVGERDVVQFDPRFESVPEDTQPWSAYPELATSDELLQMVLAEIGADLPEVATVQGLRGLVEAEAGDHPSIVYLTVRHGDPEMAAAVANTWATLFVSWAGNIYQAGNGEQLAFFENQLEQVEAELAEAEEALVAFEAHNRSSILGNQLSALRDTQTRYLNQQQSIRFLLADMRDLRDQLAKEPGDEAVGFADQLAALSLQLQAFNAQGQHPLQFQTSTEVELTGRSREEQIRYLDGIIATLETRMEEIEGSLEELEPQILEVQAEKQAVDVERARLQRDQNVAAETHQALARKVAEEGIVAENVDQGVRLASRAAVPVLPAGSGRLIKSGVSGVLGFGLAVFIILALTWWKSEMMGSEPTQEEGQRMPDRPAPGRSGQQPALKRADSGS